MSKGRQEVVVSRNSCFQYTVKTIYHAFILSQMDPVFFCFTGSYTFGYIYIAQKYVLVSYLSDIA